MEFCHLKNILCTQFSSFFEKQMRWKILLMSFYRKTQNFLHRKSKIVSSILLITIFKCLGGRKVNCDPILFCRRKQIKMKSKLSELFTIEILNVCVEGWPDRMIDRWSGSPERVFQKWSLLNLNVLSSSEQCPLKITSS